MPLTKRIKLMKTGKMRIIDFSHILGGTETKDDNLRLGSFCGDDNLYIHFECTKKGLSEP